MRTRQPPALILVILAGLLTGGCTTTSPRRPSSTQGSSGSDTALDREEQEARSRALASHEAAAAAAEAARGSSATDLLERGDEVFEKAQVARYNNMWRAAAGLFNEAEEYYRLAREMGRDAGVPESAATPAIDIPEATPVEGASPQAVEALFQEVDRVQQMAYLGGALEVAGDLIQEADALLWDAQIAQQSGDPELAAGLLTRIQALYAEAHRLTLEHRRASGAQQPVGDRPAAGPVRWANSLAAARQAVREGRGRAVLLFLYDRIGPEVAGLFSDAQVCAAMEQVQAAKHRVTDIVAGVDPVLLSPTDLEVQGLIESYALRSFPAILLLDREGGYLDSISGIQEREEILDFLVDVP